MAPHTSAISRASVMGVSTLIFGNVLIQITLKCPYNNIYDLAATPENFPIFLTEVKLLILIWTNFQMELLVQRQFFLPLCHTWPKGIVMCVSVLLSFILDWGPKNIHQPYFTCQIIDTHVLIYRPIHDCIYFVVKKKLKKKKKKKYCHKLPCKNHAR